MTVGFVDPLAFLCLFSQIRIQERTVKVGLETSAAAEEAAEDTLEAASSADANGSR